MMQKKSIEEKNDLSQDEFEKRCAGLATSITTVLFRYIERGVFARDQLTVATLLSFAVADASGNLNTAQLLRLLSPKEALEPAGMAEDVAAWLPERIWAQLKGLEDGASDILGLDALADLGDQVNSEPDEWHNWYEHSEPETQPLPAQAGRDS